MRLLAGVLFLVATGCSEDAPGGSASSSTTATKVSACDNRAIESRCIDFWENATESEVDGACDGTVAAVSCARATSVGTCLVTGENGAGAGKKLTGVYYPDGPKPWTSETARADCAKLKGTFTP